MIFLNLFILILNINKENKYKMARKFIKIDEYIINLDNVNYIDTENGDDITFYFNAGYSLDFTKTKKLYNLVKELLINEEPKENKKVIE